MLRDLFINIAVLICLLFIANHFFEKRRFRQMSARAVVVWIGIAYGAMGIAMLFFRFTLAPDIFVDMRHLPIMLAALYGNWISSLITGLFVGMGRVLLTGIDAMAIVGLGSAIVLGLVCGWLARLFPNKWASGLLIMVYILLHNVLVFSFLLPYKTKLLQVALGFWTILFLGGTLSLYVTEYLHRSNELVRLLKATKEQLESFIMYSADAIVILDTGLRIRQVNPSFEAMYGWKEGEILGTSFSMMPEFEKGFPRETFDRVAQGERVVGREIVVRCKDGSTRIATITISVIKDEQERLVGFSIVARDITEKRKSEELLQKSERLTMIGEMAAGIAHEIRNPLTTLKGFVQLMRKDASQTAYFDLMFSELERIETITDEFLGLAKPQVSEFKEKDVRQLLDNVVMLLNTQAILQNIEIETVYQDVPLIVCAENHLKQVFINIIKNAIEAMSDGGKITIRVHPEHNETDRVRISIEDQGCGIPEDRMAKLGEPFYTLKEKGTGLGLMICYKFIKEHGGQLFFVSKEGKGTTVHIVLPVRQEAGAALLLQ
jgi:PAS domain S-box-containing protein